MPQGWWRGNECQDKKESLASLNLNLKDTKVSDDELNVTLNVWNLMENPSVQIMYVLNCHYYDHDDHN